MAEFRGLNVPPNNFGRELKNATANDFQKLSKTHQQIHSQVTRLCNEGNSRIEVGGSLWTLEQLASAHDATVEKLTELDPDFNHTTPLPPDCAQITQESLREANPLGLPNPDELIEQVQASEDEAELRDLLAGIEAIMRGEVTETGNYSADRLQEARETILIRLAEVQAGQVLSEQRGIPGVPPESFTLPRPAVFWRAFRRVSSLRLLRWHRKFHDKEEEILTNNPTGTVEGWNIFQVKRAHDLIVDRLAELEPAYGHESELKIPPFVKQLSDKPSSGDGKSPSSDDKGSSSDGKGASSSDGEKAPSKQLQEALSRSEIARRVKEGDPYLNLIPGYIQLVGSTLHRESPNDNDLLIRSDRFDPATMFRLREILGDAWDDIQPIWNPQGPHDTSLPLYHLALVRADEAPHEELSLAEVQRSDAGSLWDRVRNFFAREQEEDAEDEVVQRGKRELDQLAQKLRYIRSAERVNDIVEKAKAELPKRLAEFEERGQKLLQIKFAKAEVREKVEALEPLQEQEDGPEDVDLEDEDEQEPESGFVAPMKASRKTEFSVSKSVDLPERIHGAD